MDVRSVTGHLRRALCIGATLALLAACAESNSGSSNEPCKTSGAVPVNDPLFGCQWYLRNLGQTAFASNKGVPGQDINWKDVTETGDGVIVGIVDSGLEIAHQDLAANISTASDAVSFNFLNGSANPTNTVIDGDHGTALAGLVAAKRDNGVGLTGVAGDALLVGYNFTKTQSNADQLSGLGGAGYSAGVHIFNQSYGTNQNIPITIDQLNFMLPDHLEFGTTNLRNFKGAIYVKSSGNGFRVLQNSQTTGACNRALSAGLSCQNASMDPSNTLPYNIVVGAVNADGVRSSYSTAGSALWLSAPGGEPGFNFNQGWPTTTPGFAFEPGIVTTDQSGCSKGYARTGQPDRLRNGFQDGDSKWNRSCNYSAAFTGTSASAPIVSGVAALMLEANPDLTWRDVKHILATTATRVDAGRDPTKISLGNGKYTAEPGWTVNDAGYAFHNWYGFGRVNAGEAVAMATTYVLGSLGTMSNTTSSCTVDAASIPDNSTTGARGTCTEVSSFTFIEAVQVTVDITHGAWGDLAVELTSPRGTRSMLLTGYNGFQFAGSKAIVLLTNAFYGEADTTAGTDTWRLKVVDTVSGNTGTLSNWSITIFGH